MMKIALLLCKIEQIENTREAAEINAPPVVHTKQGVKGRAKSLHRSTSSGDIHLSRVKLVLVHRHSRVCLDLGALHPAPDIYVAILEDCHCVAETAAEVNHLARQFDCRKAEDRVETRVEGGRANVRRGSIEDGALDSKRQRVTTHQNASAVAATD